VVSKEEEAVGRKGSGGAWGSTSRNAGLTGPQNGQYEHWQKKKKPNIRSFGCGLQFGGAENGNFLSGLKLSGGRDGGLGLARFSVVCPLGGHLCANGLLWHAGMAGAACMGLTT
jgi:hypothetical protein